MFLLKNENYLNILFQSNPGFCCLGVIVPDLSPCGTSTSKVGCLKLGSVFP